MVETVCLDNLLLAIKGKEQILAHFNNIKSEDWPNVYLWSFLFVLVLVMAFYLSNNLSEDG